MTLELALILLGAATCFSWCKTFGVGKSESPDIVGLSVILALVLIAVTLFFTAKNYNLL